MDALMQAGGRANSGSHKEWWQSAGTHFNLGVRVCERSSDLNYFFLMSRSREDAQRLTLQPASPLARSQYVASPPRPADLPRADHLRRSRRGPARAPRPAGHGILNARRILDPLLNAPTFRGVHSIFNLLALAVFNPYNLPDPQHYALPLALALGNTVALHNGHSVALRDTLRHDLDIALSDTLWHERPNGNILDNCDALPHAACHCLEHPHEHQHINASQHTQQDADPRRHPIPHRHADPEQHADGHGIADAHAHSDTLIDADGELHGHAELHKHSVSLRHLH